MSLAPQAPPLATLGLGLVLGLKHALDADHLVAVATIVGRNKSLWRSSIVGAWWGLGHTTSLLAASAVVFLLRRTIPERAALSLELGVGLMLVLLGGDLLRKLIAGELRLHAHAHAHDGDPHTHLHAHEGAAAASHAAHHGGKKPFLVGLVHGLAGSAALTLVVLSTITSPWPGLFYVLVFGAGTILGMLVMSTLVGLPFALAARTASGLSVRVQALAAVGSIGFGVWYAWGAARAIHLIG
jgi:hypothetical protein